MRSFFSLGVLLLLALPAVADTFSDVATLTATFDPPRAKPGEVITLTLTVKPNRERNAYTYPATKHDHGGKSEIGFGLRGDVVLVGELVNPPGTVEKAPEQGELDDVYKSPVQWKISAIVLPTAKPGKREIVLTETRIQACTMGTRENCYNQRDPKATLEILEAAPVAIPSQFQNEVTQATAPVPTVATVLPSPPTVTPPVASGLIQKPPIPTSEYVAALESVQTKIVLADGVSATGSGSGSSLATLLLAAAFWGIVSLVTPCVFPMIPITVSLFLKQSHQSTATVLKLAMVYCLTIIIVLGASAIFLLSVFRELSIDPYMNLFLGGLFVFFALSLFGMYDIALPGFLLRFTEKRRGSGGMIGTVFGALAFSIVSFTCVAPFLGGFAGMTASGNFTRGELILAGIVFAAAFASPFFVLALFPSLIKKLPKSGGWLDSVKAVMGFLELAAAFKFFRTAELRLLDHSEYFTYDFSLAAWVAIAGVTGVYLLNLFRLPHDEEQQANVGVLRLLFGLMFLTLAVYLAPGLFKSEGESQRPKGAVFAWVDAFLLPEPVEAGDRELPWSTNLPGAIESIRQEKLNGTARKPYIFVDFTGVTCTNCKLNEKNVFPQANIRQLLSRYTLVQMYTDEVPVAFYTSLPESRLRKAEATANLNFQRQIFGTEQLPLYAILEPLTTGQVRVVSVYDEGKINEVERFEMFLRKPLGE
ncbi:MAG: hypothetical protein LC104_18070 [Bacteroidales bacterium]|nr:hypothetical protein [Bacteroidales bacterium]